MAKKQVITTPIQTFQMEIPPIGVQLRKQKLHIRGSEKSRRIEEEPTTEGNLVLENQVSQVLLLLIFSFSKNMYCLVIVFSLTNIIGGHKCW